MTNQIALRAVQGVARMTLFGLASLHRAINAGATIDAPIVFKTPLLEVAPIATKATDLTTSLSEH